jgi:hypothetical protein
MAEAMPPGQTEILTQTHIAGQCRLHLRIRANRLAFPFPEEVWPWLMQMGYRCGGWYGYERVDNDGIPSTVQVLPE